MKTNLIRLLAVLLMPWASLAGALAWDANPDPVTGKYDKYYDRPTHFPDWKQPSDWPNNMAYFVCVRFGSDSDVRLQNYEVAVYDQNNRLRHCGRSYAGDNHLCTLTIMGEEGDTFRFEVIYGDNFDNPIIQAVPNLTVPFETDFVTGNKVRPYWLTLPNTNAGIAAPNSEQMWNGQRWQLNGTRSEHGRPGLYIVDGKKYFIK